VGRQGFRELDLEVTADVLIPRPETELVIEMTLEVLDAGPQRLADLGTGSGAIALALANARPEWRLIATDRSPAALEVARRNVSATGLGSQVRLIESDWYTGLDASDMPLDTIVSNPPYVAANDPHLEHGDIRFEPEIALASSPDGLWHLRALVESARSKLSDDGWLLLEHGYDQAAAVRELFRVNGYENIESRRDLAGIERVTGGRLVTSEWK